MRDIVRITEDAPALAGAPLPETAGISQTGSRRVTAWIPNLLATAPLGDGEIEPWIGPKAVW